MIYEGVVNQDAAIPDRDFYVTVREHAGGGRYGFLLGPYSDWTGALGNVRRGRELAQQHNSRAWSYAYGTASLPAGEQVTTVFGR